jgi:hypothetical protein
MPPEEETLFIVRKMNGLGLVVLNREGASREKDATAPGFTFLPDHKPQDDGGHKG